jgi:predicted transcriptional regulator
MRLPKLTKLELQIMEALWTQGACAVREIHQAFPERGRPAFTTVQTTIYRLGRARKPFVASSGSATPTFSRP